MIEPTNRSTYNDNDEHNSCAPPSPPYVPIVESVCVHTPENTSI